MPRLTFASGRHESFAGPDGIETVSKDIDSIESFTLDWSLDLGTDTISTSTWETSGPTAVSSSNTTTTTTIKASGAGELKNKVVTNGGSTYVYRVNLLGIRR